MPPLTIVISIEAKLKTAIATGVVTSDEGFKDFVENLEVATTADGESVTGNNVLAGWVAVAHDVNPGISFEGREMDPAVRRFWNILTRKKGREFSELVVEIVDV